MPFSITSNITSHPVGSMFGPYTQEHRHLFTHHLATPFMELRSWLRLRVEHRSLERRRITLVTDTHRQLGLSPGATRASKIAMQPCIHGLPQSLLVQEPDWRRLFGRQAYWGMDCGWGDYHPNRVPQCKPDHSPTTLIPRRLESDSLRALNT